MTTTKESKRILSVTIRREVDSDPDTSFYGEYAREASSEYSIDRAHSEDCKSLFKGELEDDECGQCGSYHPVGFTGECRDDANRFPTWDLSDCCDCNGGDMGRGEYRYFNPSFNYVDKNGAALPENTPEEVRKYVRQDYERMESLNRGAWCFVGVFAEAEVQTNGMSTIQTIRSGGLWGIESDSDRDHFRMVESEELETLRTELHAIGFSKRAISHGFCPQTGREGHPQRNNSHPGKR